MPAEPLRLQVIDRVVDVLNGIREGEDYFYSPRQVGKGFISEPVAYPVYMVRSESGGDIEMHTDAQFAETFYLSINGRVQEMGDVVTPLERAIRDVRKAIDADCRSGAGAGSLITLATAVVFDAPPEITYDADNVGPFAEFSQRVRITISGEFGEI
jgi:hypothetical protein